MRIGSANLFDRGTDAIAERQAELALTQERIATGRRMLSPSDDPGAASQALQLRQSSELTAQYRSNQQSALSSLQLAEATLGSVTLLLQDARALAVSAGNATLRDTDRQAIAQEISSRLTELITLANAGDGSGGYLFSGYSDRTRPFALSGGSVAYAGDQGARSLQVAESRAIAIGDSGAEIFQRIDLGNGVFATAAGSGNTGTGLIDTGQVTDATALTGHSYRISFAGSGSATTYTVTDTTSSTTVASNVSYSSGSAIAFAGIQIEISGQPAAGDVFDLTPATAQSVFTTLQQIVSTLGATVSTPAERTALANGLSGGLKNLDNALDHVLSVRASMGARMREIDALQDQSSERAGALAQAISRVEDLDYAEAASQLARQQLVLEAAQKTFLKISTLSLFNYL